jgi:nucleoside-diphosphate-sugar epimerase
VKSFRESAVKFRGLDPRTQFVHEGDVASAFIQAARTDMPGAYNLARDEFIHMSEVYRIIGVKSVRTMPLWLARLITDIRWRYFSTSTHPSWLDFQLADCTFSNARLKGTGWKPRYSCAKALRSAL